jgi:hypothetical protein
VSHACVWQVHERSRAKYVIFCVIVKHICTVEGVSWFYSFQMHVVMIVIRVTTADGHAVSSDKPPLLIRTVDDAVFIICVTFEATIDLVCPSLQNLIIVQPVCSVRCNKITERLYGLFNYV